MKSIPYGSDSIPLHFRFPSEWDVSLISDVSLTIKDRNAAELMAADLATLWNRTALDGDVDQWAGSVILTDTASRAVFKSAVATAATYAALTNTGKMKVTEAGQTGVDINPDFTGCTTMALVCAAVETAMTGVVAGYSCALDDFDRPTITSDNTGPDAAAVTISTPDDGIDLTGSAYFGAATSYDGGSSLSKDDEIQIYGASGTERHTVKGYNSTTFTATLDDIVKLAFDDGDTVIGCFADYSLDISDTDTFTDGIVLRLIWTPVGDGQPFTELVQVASAAASVEGLRQDLKDAWPRVYDSFTGPIDRFDRMMTIAKRRMRNEAMSWQPPVDIDRIVDQNVTKDALLAWMAELWVLNADDSNDLESKKDERENIAVEKASQIKILQSAIWRDDNMDGVEDDDEVGDLEPVYTRNWS